MWMAMAPRAGTMPLNLPPETVNLQPISKRESHDGMHGNEWNARVVASALAVGQRAADNVAVDTVREGRRERLYPIRAVLVVHREEARRSYKHGYA